MSSNINPYLLKNDNFFIKNFYDDYFGVLWNTSNTETTIITYSFPSKELKTITEGVTDKISRIFSDSEKALINNSINAWDNAIDKIEFRLVNDNSEADITFGLTYIDGKGGGKAGWSAGQSSKLFVFATIYFEADDIISSNDLVQMSLASIGNVLGLGDIEATDSFVSVMEKPTSYLYPENIILGDYDVAMIKTLYNESSFLSKDTNSSKKILFSHDNSENTVIMEVTNGDAIGIVKIEFLPKFAPNHVKQIQSLIENNFYDGLLFHRVIEGFMAQTGSPNGDGTGGSSLPNIDSEFSLITYERGTVGMARSNDADSANSQFFITFQDYPSLDNEYTVFGKVLSGMEFIDALQRGEPPASPDSIISMSILEFKQYGTFNYSNNDDIIIATSTHSTYRGLAGDDIYFISHLLKENEKISIIDTEGYNTIQLPSNTYIDSAIFSKDAAQLIFESGRQVTINGADKFNYNLSGNVTSNEEGVDLSFSDFALIFGIENILTSDFVEDAVFTDMYIVWWDLISWINKYFFIIIYLYIYFRLLLVLVEIFGE